MGRIRTIKPEFPQSESIGRLSRDARLTFILLWTIADDAGRLRGHPRAIASLIYPYDQDAGKHIATWLQELESEDCITAYVVGKDAYIQINNWLKHQKIERPSPSRLPSIDEGARAFGEASPINHRSFTEASPQDMDLGPRTKDMDHAACAEETEAVSIWNDMASKAGLSSVQKLTNGRRAKLKARLKDCGGLPGWMSACERLSQTPWMLGDNDRGWKADFDFIVQEKSFTKLMEGSYDRSKSHRHAFGNGFAAIAAGEVD